MLRLSVLGQGCGYNIPQGKVGEGGGVGLGRGNGGGRGGLRMDSRGGGQCGTKRWRKGEVDRGAGNLNKAASTGGAVWIQTARRQGGVQEVWV